MMLCPAFAVGDNTCLLRWPAFPIPKTLTQHISSIVITHNPFTMLQRHALRRLRCAAGRSRLPVAPQQGFLHFHRSLATPAASPSPNDPFANGTNAHYAEEMYRRWRQDPTSVHASWDAYFSGLEKGLGPNAFQLPPKFLPAPADGAPALHAAGGAQLDDHLKVRP
jgi:2-oxoglutarate dehydrogenase E1 component